MDNTVCYSEYEIEERETEATTSTVEYEVKCEDEYRKVSEKKVMQTLTHIIYSGVSKAALWKLRKKEPLQKSQFQSKNKYVLKKV